MENVVLINRRDLDEILEKLNIIHRFIVKEDIKPARRLQENWLSANEAAQVLRCSMRTIYTYIDQGLLPRRKHRRRLYFLAEDLENFMLGKYGYNPNELFKKKVYRNDERV